MAERVVERPAGPPVQGPHHGVFTAVVGVGGMDGDARVLSAGSCTARPAVRSPDAVHHVSGVRLDVDRPPGRTRGAWRSRGPSGRPARPPTRGNRGSWWSWRGSPAGACPPPASAAARPRLPRSRATAGHPGAGPRSPPAGPEAPRRRAQPVPANAASTSSASLDAEPRLPQEARQGRGRLRERVPGIRVPSYAAQEQRPRSRQAARRHRDSCSTPAAGTRGATDG